MITWVLLTILLGTAGELLTLPAAPGSVVLLQVPAVDRDSREGRLLWRNSGLDSTEGKNLSQFSMRMAMTSLQNLMSIIEATVSSRGRRRPGPNTTPRLEAVIRFLSLFTATLFR